MSDVSGNTMSDHIADLFTGALAYDKLVVARLLTEGTPAHAHRCSGDDNCCSVYEQCVSCCMKPANNAMEAVKKVYRGPNRCLLPQRQCVHTCLR